ncbi:aminoglycoside phosphotransferase (APT) family kinase protein [Cryobacterium mesophilum]|uniref:Aminoglycoside phosphotransferase family protein n=1 Tax=Terrimesophilobacter mesophilus TaxID=433647 RepID=A0A4R8VA24_9MICO|nr:aminoglycoside phosphotransferase family protein [Terrimesophilobacter mesophilus]MBB5632567.1 aminoglycoside phosphotransferase (APT) family kinase protein [Terrimesophilobacter mesophilus]TFB79385.1 aminoglycoside phosphotransferase family protein [Terrimesophilobacter mesophilus]
MDAETDIDVSLVRRLVSAQHPDLLGTIRFFDNGWDNALFRLGDTLLVRLPRREAAAELAMHEQRWLPEIAQRLDVAVPVPKRVGHPDIGFPWHWSIVPWFDGTTAASASRSDLGRLASDLARFVGQLHTPAPTDAPISPVRGVPLSRRDESMQARFDRGSLPRSAELAALWSRLVATPAWSGPPLWLHGDLHPMNLVLDTTGRLSAVIDFGDVCGGDPATDLAVAWLAFDPAERLAFRALVDTDAGYDEHTWQRARGWALVLASAILHGSAHDSPMIAFANHALAQVLLEE